MGDSLLGGIRTVSQALSERQAAGLVGPPPPLAPDTHQPVQVLQEVQGQQAGATGAVTPGEREAAEARAVYWDVLGYFMVRYGKRV